MRRLPKIPTARFNLKNHSDKETLIVLFYRYRPFRGDKTARLVWSTGEKINPKHWSKKDGAAKLMPGQTEYVALNDRLKESAKHARDIFTEHDFGNISVDDFKQELSYRTGKEIRPDDSVTLFSFIEKYIERHKSTANAKRGTWKKFGSVLKHLQDYATEKGIELDFDSIEWNFKHEFVQWLYLPPRNHAINNASKIMQLLKQFMREAYREGHHTNMIFNDTKFGVERVKVKNKVRLTFDEIEKIIAHDFSDNPRLEKVRDLSIVGFYTGLRFSDWYKIKPDQVVTDDGVQMIEIMTEKTKDVVTIPFLPELKAVLEKYNFNLPEISSQNFNKYMKEVCKKILPDAKYLRKYSEAGKELSEWTPKHERISSHACRRSFATNFWELGIPASELMQITGHTTEKVFFNYIDVDKRKMAKQFAKVATMRMNDRKKLRVVS